SASAAAAAAVAGPGATAVAAAPEELPSVRVRPDVLDVEIGTRGGTLERVDLLAYPRVKGESTPVRLENQDDPQSLYLLQSGLTGPAGGEYPTHRARYTA